jgi:ABC transport system ATP-binding/permease protein
VMASRWAFEAFMVTQFRDNAFEKQFYEFDKTIAEADYKRIYYIPTLESELAYTLNNRSQWRNIRNEKVSASLALVQKEIGYELETIGRENFPEVDRLAIGKFDSTVYVKSMKFLVTLKQFYANKQNTAIRKKEDLIATLTDTPEKAQAFEDARQRYQNKMVSAAVKNTGTTDRVVLYNGRLVQKIYPIYSDDHKPSFPLDFSANLFQPTKHFAGINFNTLYFNIAVIWSMTLGLFVTLYFDLLRKIMGVFENKKYRKNAKA